MYGTSAEISTHVLSPMQAPSYELKITWKIMPMTTRLETCYACASAMVTRPLVNGLFSILRRLSWGRPLSSAGYWAIQSTWRGVALDAGGYDNICIAVVSLIGDDQDAPVAISPVRRFWYAVREVLHL